MKPRKINRPGLDEVNHGGIMKPLRGYWFIGFCSRVLRYWSVVNEEYRFVCGGKVEHLSGQNVKVEKPPEGGFFAIAYIF